MSALRWVGFALFATPACITPNVVERSARAVEASVDTLDWSAAQASDVAGYFESEEIHGEAAGSLSRIYYHFAPDVVDATRASGTYTGAALVLGGATPQFQTLSGAWSLVDGWLEFSDGSRARAFAAPGRLKLETEGAQRSCAAPRSNEHHASPAGESRTTSGSTNAMRRSSSEPYAFSQQHLTEAQALCPRAQVRLVDGELLSWHGPRTAAGLRLLRSMAAALAH